MVGAEVGEVEELCEWFLSVCEVIEKAEVGGTWTYYAPDFRRRRVDLNGGGYHCIERELWS